MDYYLTIASQILIVIILAQSYNLVMGYGGMIHVGHVGFMAIGAYGSALLTLGGAPFLVGVVGAVGAAAAAGLVLGIPTVRLREDYLVAATLGMGEIIRIVLLNERSFTGGSSGLSKIMRPEIFGLTLTSPASLAVFLALVTALVLFFIARLIRSPFGRTLESIREDELAAQSLGKNSSARKLQILVIAAAFAGFSGALYAHALQFIDPDTFNIHRMMFIFLIVVFGGSGTFWGPVVGTAVVMAIAESMRFLPIPAGMIGPVRWILYASLLIGMILVRPKGLLGGRLVRKKL